ncbi:uncharacterized protein [Procambarus clarkii]|uniref:uncharacterized protein isoform X1 n=1 Tax=Procambarus clarkii TaxID=6728 RepID=UPI001E674200|nr:uncharacterized protein LOC123775034 isoform X3 [Procambarus clarkii]
MEKERLRRLNGRTSRRSSVVNIIKRPCGMSKAAFSGLKVTVLWVSYLLLGSAVFIYLEETEETISAIADHQHWARFKELVSAGDVVQELYALRENLLVLCPHPLFNTSSMYTCNHTFSQMENGTDFSELDNATTASPLLAVLQRVEAGGAWWEQVEEECTDSLRIIQEVTETKAWSLVDAIYFTMTAVTTIGYGHIAPMTRAGRRFCVLYSLVGVPLTCILLAKSSDMLSNRMLQLYTTAKKRHQRHQKALLYGITLMFLSVGFIVFMFLPSVVLSKLEDWSYEDSLYYTFITLSTIGFGDLIAGYNADIQYQDLYKMGIVVWIMLALGYWFLLHSFLQKALRKNVPQRIKKSIRRSTRITRQSEFFRQLVGKLRPSKFSSLSETRIAPNLVHKLKVVSQRVRAGEQQDEPGTDAGMVALMVEVADVLDSRRPSRKPSRKPSLLPSAQEDTCDSQGELEPALTLSQLLDVNVIVRSEAVPSIRNVIAQSPNEHEFSKTLSGILNRNGFGSGEPAHSQHIVQCQPKEVTLSLREVLNLVALVKSIEDEVAAPDINSSSSSVRDDINSPSSSPTNSLPSVDQREFAPLLQGNFYKPPSKHIKLCTPIRRLSQKEEEVLEESLQEVFCSYSDAEESDTEGDRDSQEDDEKSDEHMA